MHFIIDAVLLTQNRRLLDNICLKKEVHVEHIRYPHTGSAIFCSIVGIAPYSAILQELETIPSQC